jgi:hypothetical protein
LNELKTITLDTVQSRTVAYLWDGFIPLGTVSVMLGDGSVGKSWLSMAIAAAVTKGDSLPGSVSVLPPSDVLIQNAENALDMVIKPRLDLLGADCSRVHVIDDSEQRLTLDDSRIEEAIIKHNARLTIIDPIQSYLGDFSMNRAESIRKLLMRLEKTAERTNSALLIVGHLNKGTGKAAYRGLGSIDIFNSVPSVMYLGRYEEDEPDLRVVVHGKANLSELAPSQSFSLSKERGFEWRGERDVTLDELLAFRPSKSRGAKMEEATEFLRDILSGGEMAAAEIYELADNSDIAKHTLDRAKAALNVSSRKADGRWLWSL